MKRFLPSSSTRIVGAAISLFALAAATIAGAGCSGPDLCNGSAELCGRRYDQVTFPGTHDSFSTTEDSFGAPDQTHVVPTQLADGIRVIHMEVFHTDSGDFVCHGLCAIGEKPLGDALTDVRVFLDAHPREVVTLLPESNGVSPVEMVAAFTQAGLVHYAHPQAKSDPWPTLAQLIDRNERLVVLADNGGTGDPPYPWYIDRWQYTWETPWETDEPEDFSCALDRGMASAPLYTVDEFLDSPIKDPVPRPARAALVNYDPFFVDRLLRCQQQAHQLPNIVLVNYYEVGDVFRATAILNGLAPAPDGGESADAAAAVDGLPDGGFDGGEDYLTPSSG